MFTVDINVSTLNSYWKKYFLPLMIFGVFLSSEDHFSPSRVSCFERRYKFVRLSEVRLLLPSTFRYDELPISTE